MWDAYFSTTRQGCFRFRERSTSSQSVSWSLIPQGPPSFSEKTIGEQRQFWSGEEVEIAIFVLIMVLLVIFIVVWFLLSDRFLRRWDAEESERRRRKKEMLEKQLLNQPQHCPYCGEVILSPSSDCAQCPKCGRRVMTKGT